MGPDTSTIINASAWKYEASQIAKNQDIENLLKRENKAVSLGKLIKVSVSFLFQTSIEYMSFYPTYRFSYLLLYSAKNK